MEHTESRFRGADGLELYMQSWRPDGRPKAVLAIVHGHGEHSGRYRNVFEYFAPRGYALHAYDLRGHGRSSGQRGSIHDWADYREDTRTFLGLVRAGEPGIPLFLFGHSLGGLIVLDYGLHTTDDLKGVVASGPVLGPPQIPAALLGLSKVLSRVWPRFSLNSGLDATAISRDPAVVKAYVEDPLVHSKGTARLGAEMLRTTEWVQAKAAEWRLPLLIVHGADDRLAPPAFSRQFFEKVAIADKTRIEYPGGFHEPHNDLEKATVFADIERWIEQHRRP
jgi:alpha-beta hydrolase superfamily lysophospholipase